MGVLSVIVQHDCELLHTTAPRHYLLTNICLFRGKHSQPQSSPSRCSTEHVMWVQVLMKKFPVVVFSGLMRDLNSSFKLHHFVQDVVVAHAHEATQQQLVTMAQSLTRTKLQCNSSNNTNTGNVVVGFGRALEPLQVAVRGTVDGGEGREALDANSLIAVMKAFREGGEQPPIELKINYSPPGK